MAKRPKAIVLDSWAVIAYLEDEPASEKVANIMADAQEQEIPLLMMTEVNAGETWYIIARRTSKADADRTIKELQDLGIEFVDADWNLAQRAGYFKPKNKMSFAGCFASALAKEREAHLVTGDPEFRQVEREISVLWLTTASR
jgi:predicted nucleic acid-binding protein